MPIQADPDGTLDIENATLRSRGIVALTNLVAGNDVVRGSGAPTLEVYGDPGPRLELVSNTAATDGTATFTRLESNDGVFSIQSGTDASDNGTITFGGFQNERMRINADGNVGIGVTDPGGKLNVKSGVFLSENQASTNGVVLYYDEGGSGGTDNNQYTLNNAKFGTGIFVNDTGTTGSTITLMNKEGANNTTKHASIGFVNTDTTFNGKFGGQIGFWPEDNNATKQQFRIYTSGASAGYNLPVQQMVVTGDGNVGIGKTDPSCTLDIDGSTSQYTGIFSNRLWLDNVGDNSGDGSPDDNTGSPWYGLGYDDLAWNVSTQRYSGDIPILSGYNGVALRSGAGNLVLTTAGNVGIGTTNPLCKLDVAGAIYLRAETIGGIDLDGGSDLSNRSNTYIAFGDAGTVTDWAYLRQIGGANDYTLALDLHDDGDEGGFVIRDITSTANPDTIKTRFKVAKNGLVGIGTDPVFRLDLGDDSTGCSLGFGPSVATDNNRGIYWSTDGNYAIKRGSGAWSSPNYAQLELKWITGIVLDAGDGTYGRSYVGVNDRMAIGSQYYNSNTKPPNNGLLVQGNVGIGTDNPSYKLHVYGSAFLGGDNTQVFVGSNLGGIFARFNDDLWFSDPQNATIEIRNVSDTAAGTMVGNFNPPSSITLKKDVEVLGDDDLNRFYTDTMETDLHSYYYKDEVEGEDKKRVGIILERAPDYFAGTRGGKSLNMTHWNTMLHGACKVIDKNVKTVMNDMKNHLDFTGQHRTFISNIPLSEYEKYEGLIVSADMNEYYNDSIEINEALPIVSLCKKSMDKACFGVISTKEDPNNYEYNAYITREDGDIRAKINSIGEGAIWVINANGNLESGDYITTSNCAMGYGQKQDDDILHNYTVAKITMDCDFNNSSKKKKQIKKEVAAVTYYVKDEESIVDEYVYDTWDSTKRQIKEIECYTKEVIYSYSEPKEGGWVEYESNSGSKSMNEEEYTSATPEEKAEYKPVYKKKITKTLSTLDYNTTKLDDIKNEYQKNKHTFHFITVHKETKTPTDGYESEIRQELVNALDEHGQIQWEDVPTETEKVYKIRYLDASGVITDEANAVHTAAFVGCTYHCG
jgi:hypothetical protein